MGKTSLNGTRPPPSNDGDRSRVLPKGPSVNADATRSSNGVVSKTLGPRTA